MEIQKRLENIKHRLGDELSKQLKNVDLEAVLGAFGLQLATRHRSMALPVIAAFGVGLTVGVLFAPVSGKALRHKLMLAIGKVTQGDKEQGAGESPYEKAKAQHEEADRTFGEPTVYVAEAANTTT